MPKNVQQKADNSHDSQNHVCCFRCAIIGFQILATNGHTSVKGESHRKPDGTVRKSVKKDSMDVTQSNIPEENKLFPVNNRNLPQYKIGYNDQEIGKRHAYQGGIHTSGEETLSLKQDCNRQHVNCEKTGDRENVHLSRGNRIGGVLKPGSTQEWKIAREVNRPSHCQPLAD